MTPPFRYRLSDREKDALLSEQAARIAELEGLLCRPRKTSRNSGLPPSCDQKARAARSLADTPDETIKRLATACPNCAADVSGQMQGCRQRYDYIDLPPIAPVVTRIELFGGRCNCCGRRFRATAPAGRELQAAVKGWRTKFFVFLEDPDVPPTNNACEREIRPSVVFRKVTGGFRSPWGAQIHAGYRSVTGTARLQGQSALQAIDQLLSITFEPTPAT